jgi:hypothetical protein
VQLATASSVNSQVFASGHFHASSFDDFAATQNATNNIIVFLSSATGTFNGGGRAITVGDYNGDGLPDAIVGSAPAWVFLNTSK